MSLEDICYRVVCYHCLQIPLREGGREGGREHNGGREGGREGGSIMEGGKGVQGKQTQKG